MTFPKIVVQALQSHSGVLSSNHLSEEIEKLDVSHMRSNSRMRSAGGSDAAADGYADDIETEANAYFHQMFSGNLSIDAMIQMLTRFKESPEERYFLPFKLQDDSFGMLFEKVHATSDYRLLSDVIIYAYALTTKAGIHFVNHIVSLELLL